MMICHAEYIKDQTIQKKSAKFVSVVILSLNPPQELLNQLHAQTYKDFEIIIASEKGIVNAMNKALEAASGEIFVRIDDDVELPKEWLSELIKPFYDDFVAGATGPTFVPKERREYRDSIKAAENPKRFLNWMFDGLIFAPSHIYKCGSVSYDSNYEGKFLAFPSKALSQPAHLEGTNWAMRTELIRKVGGFDLAFDGVAEWFDTDVEFKIKKLGYQLRYNPKAYLYHLLGKGSHFSERFEGFGRLKNWLRFHIRHSKFHPKMIAWFLLMCGYFIWRSFCKSSR